MPPDFNLPAWTRLDMKKAGTLVFIRYSGLGWSVSDLLMVVEFNKKRNPRLS